MISKLFIFLAVLASASIANAEWMSVIPGTPERGVSKLFGIPTWIAHIKDYDADAMNATTIFSVVCIAFSTLNAIYFIFFIHLPKLPRNQKTIGPFNSLVALYLVATFFASLSFSIMSVGRIWASFGVFHNLFEIALLSIIMIRQKSVTQRGFVATCFIYILCTMFIVIIAPWPLDALFFKFQGLATDFALCIDLGRLYYHNKAIHEKASVGMMLVSTDDEDVSDGFNSEEDEVVHNLQRQRAKENRQMQDDPNKAAPNVTTPVHKNIVVLYIAAFLHAAGNALVTFSNDFILWVIFQFMYAIAFPMYAYYIIAEPDASRLSLYKVNYLKEMLVVCASVVLAASCIAIGIYNALNE
ncbi:hypothetical protein MFLAVUS_000636 [Mucor flavus]|uniref:Uncharacterized protein n=1 Tax=Mucor flavus TaxID=439312 RepID=A0ABP9YK89_9FUNG